MVFIKRQRLNGFAEAALFLENAFIFKQFKKKEILFLNLK